MTVEDPWGAAPQEAQAAPVAAQPEPPQEDPWGAPPPPPPAPVAPVAPPAPVAAPVATAPAPVAVAPAPVVTQEAGSTAEVAVTFKGDGQAPWVTVRATSVAEADAFLDTAFKNYLAKVQKVAGFFGSGSAPAPQRQLQPGQPAASVEAPSWAPPKPEADFVYKTGTAKSSGKTWHAWMPPTKEDSREPKFFYPPR